MLIASGVRAIINGPRIRWSNCGVRATWGIQSSISTPGWKISFAVLSTNFKNLDCSYEQVALPWRFDLFRFCW